MGTEPVHGLLIKMSAPLMLSMFVMALYNIVDSIFVGHYSTDALTAVSYCLPFQNLEAAFAVGSAVGMSALLSRYIGAKEYKKADKVAHNGFMLVAINYCLFFLIACFAPLIINAVTPDNASAELVRGATTYLRVTQFLAFLPMTQIMLERLLQATGKTKYILFSQTSGSIFNMIMDPILIFGYFGFPRLGIMGAALATVFGQLLGCVLGVIFNKKYNKEVGLRIRKIRPDLPTIKEIYKIGIPVIVMQAIGAVMSFCINLILSGISTLAVATFGVYFRLNNFVFMPIFGLNSGSVPIIAYNYGAGNRKRLEEVMRLGVRYGIGLMSIGTLVFWVFSKQLMALFNAPPEMVEMGVTALHIMSLNFPFAGFCIMRASAFQALGKSTYSMYISMARQLVVIVPCAYIFSKIGGVNMVWWAFPMAEAVGTCMTLYYTKRIRRNIISKMKPGIKVQKQAARDEAAERLAATDEEYRKSASETIMKKLLATEEYKKAATVVAYYSVGREVSTRELIDRMIADGKKVCLPRCTDLDENGERMSYTPEMETRHVPDPSKLQKGAFGIPEPDDGGEFPLVDPKEVDLVVLPCVACDDTCERLGHGAGYYDSYLTDLSGDCSKIALCYDKLILDKIPTEGHDMHMDAVISEKRIYRWRASI